MTGNRSGSSFAVRSPRARARDLVLVDTNALFLPFTAGLDLAGEVARARPGARIAVPDAVLDELDDLVARGVPSASAARELAGTFARIASSAPGDPGVLRLARARRAVVVTADRELRRRLLAAGLTVLHPRDRTRLTESRPPPSARPGPSPRATVKKRPRLARR